MTFIQPCTAVQKILKTPVSVMAIGKHIPCTWIKVSIIVDTFLPLSMQWFTTNYSRVLYKSSNNFADTCKS